ncbi:hypothetical protein [Scytonema sp. UIC 10036]|uniref:hypothetical protein n=1 Tax=Scytonema sp. UIC 10036 TaxID=2304196 RepID=UPI001FAB09A6|nr:hypothetical protein [Scytonema sp. UIC 10036]
MTIALERPKKKTRSAQIREQLGYPIIDTDVHTQEFEPAFLDYLAQVGGSKIVDRFLNHFYFGIESDDTRVAYAFHQKANPFGDTCGGQSQRVKAFLGSDSGHWDVPDITAVVSNAYSMVERGILSKEDLRYFLSIHPLELYTSLNRDFFKGTAIEKEAEEYLRVRD